MAQPLRVNTGTLPGGVAEVTVAALAAVEEEEEEEEEEEDGPADPTVPLSEVIDASFGSTRPSSWKA